MQLFVTEVTGRHWFSGLARPPRVGHGSFEYALTLRPPKGHVAVPRPRAAWILREHGPMTKRPFMIRVGKRCRKPIGGGI